MDSVENTHTLAGKNVEFRVKEIKRYIVTQHSTTVNSRGEETTDENRMIGEYGNYEVAYSVGYALAKAEHERLGYAPDDPRIQYPKTDYDRIGEAMQGSEVGHVFG